MSRKHRKATVPLATDSGQQEQKKPRRPQVGWIDHNLGAAWMGELIARPSDGWLGFITTDETLGPLNEFKAGDDVFVPPAGLRAYHECGNLYLPSTANRHVPTQELVTEIKAFIRRYASIPVEWFDPIAYYVLMTWVFDRFTALPYLRFLGESGTGKTRLLEICAALCYRAWVASGNVTGPAMFRSINIIQGTLLIDEGDFKDSHAWSDIVKTLNNGYQTGKPVIRCDTKGNFDPEPFRVFGPKVISTRQRFQDNALERRCITFETGGLRLEPHVPIQLGEPFYAEALEVRNKLLGWRFDNFDRIQLDQNQLRDLEPAVRQIGISLLAVAPDAESKRSIATFLGGYAEEAKEQSPLGLLLAVIEERKAAGNKSDTCSALAGMMNAKGEDYGFEEFKPEHVGRLARALGMTPKRTSTARLIVYGDGSSDGMTVSPARR